VLVAKECVAKPSLGARKQCKHRRDDGGTQKNGRKDGWEPQKGRKQRRWGGLKAAVPLGLGASPRPRPRNPTQPSPVAGLTGFVRPSKARTRRGIMGAGSEASTCPGTARRRSLVTGNSFFSPSPWRRAVRSVVARGEFGSAAFARPSGCGRGRAAG
jgi:hypothetical protein